MAETGGVQGAAGSEQAAREAEEARRREILAKIRQLEGEISKCRGLAESFSGLKEQLRMFISQVNGYKTMNLEAEENTFFGITANAVNKGLEDAQSVMGERSGEFSDTEAAVGTQIGLLESYIMGLRSRIDGLRAEL